MVRALGVRKKREKFDLPRLSRLWRKEKSKMASYVDMAKEVLASIAEGAKAGTPGKPGEIEAVVVPKAEAEPNLAETAGLSELAELPPIEQSLKGRAVELWRDGNRFFLVADDEDALEAMQRFGARRG